MKSTTRIPRAFASGFVKVWRFGTGVPARRVFTTSARTHGGAASGATETRILPVPLALTFS